MKVVFDTNVLISALITAGKPKELFHKVIAGEIQLVLSKDILEEFSEVADDPRIRKYADEAAVVAFLKVIDSFAKVIRVKSRFKVVKDDPDDDAILRVAFDGKVDCVVSGDKHLLALGEFKGIKILTVDKMLKILKDQKGAA